MGTAQKEALKELVAYLKNKYGISKVQKHKDVNATACPGRNYPFNEIVNAIPAPTDNSHTTFIKSVQKAIGAKVDGIVGNETRSKAPTLSKKKNSRHAVVRVVQEYLISLGYAMPRWGADGIFGSEMESAVKQFQKDKGLVADGIVGKNTWNKLLGG